jgi:hypothetical protein
MMMQAISLLGLSPLHTHNLFFFLGKNERKHEVAKKSFQLSCLSIHHMCRQRSGIPGDATVHGSTDDRFVFASHFFQISPFFLALSSLSPYVQMTRMIDAYKHVAGQVESMGSHLGRKFNT